MFRNISIVLVIGLGACVSRPAPGTRPADMTAQAHVQACRSHEQTAQAQARRARQLDGGKGTYTAEQISEQERDIARQHGHAAKLVDPSAPDCP